MTDNTPEQGPQLHKFEILAECGIREEEFAHFSVVVRELASLLAPEALGSLQAVIVVDRPNIPSKLNELIRSVDAYRSYAPGDAHAPDGVALPLEADGVLSSFVLIARETAESLSRPAPFRSPNVISTVLEELLHVCVYGRAKKRRGYVHPDQSSALPCDIDLHVIASQMCDEYVVNRLKTQILGTVPLVQEAPDRPLTVVELSYGAVPYELISQGFEKLKVILEEARSGTRPPSEAWPVVSRILYRNFFEPLSRYCAYVDDLEAFNLDLALSQIEGYREFLRPHWLKTREGLQRLITSDLNETERVLEEIIVTLRALLSQFGVVYGGTPKECWIRFLEPNS